LISTIFQFPIEIYNTPGTVKLFLSKLVKIVKKLLEFYLLMKMLLCWKHVTIGTWIISSLFVYLISNCLLNLVLMPCFLLQLFYAEYLLIPFVRWGCRGIVVDFRNSFV